MHRKTKEFKETRKELSSLRAFAQKTWKKTTAKKPERYFLDNQEIFIKNLWVATYTCLDSYFVSIFTSIKDMISDTLTNNNQLPSDILERKNDKYLWRNDINKVLKIDTNNTQISSYHRRISLSWDSRNDIIHRNQVPTWKTLLDIVNEIKDILSYLELIDEQILTKYSNIKRKLI